MKKIFSIVIAFIFIFNIYNIVFAIENDKETITLSDFIDVKKEEATSVQIYIHANLYEIDINKFFEIADECMITLSSNPQPITKDGLYIGVTSNGVVTSVYISSDGGVDNAVPAAGRQLNAVYTTDDISYVDRIIELIPEFTLSNLTMFDKKTVEKIKLYYPNTGKETVYDGAVNLESFFGIADNIMLKINSNPYEIGKNGLYMTIYDKNGNEGYVYVTEKGEIDYYSVYDRDNANPKATYIAENIDEIKKVFEKGRQETNTNSVAVNHISDWAKSDIEKAIALNIINVGGNYNFPAPITREEFCELIYNYCYNVVKEVDTVTGENKFTDTTNSKIIRLNAMGIINGKSESEFAPNDLLTREEAAVILNRMVNKTIPVPVTEMYFNFDDEASISDWASDSIQVMCNMGVMNGVGENKFAPQDTYTIEQAIVTIVRVYAAQSANTGIIGGADAPTEIHIGEDVEISDFYIDQALKHTKKAGELAGTKEFISMYIGDNEIKANMEKLSKTDFEKPAKMYYVSYNIDKAIEYYNKMFAKENPGEKIDIEKFVKLNGFSLAYIANQINGRYGGTTLAATSVLTSREGYIMPKDFEKDFGIYLQYEGDYSALVSFNKIGEGVIEARMQFVRNGEKADMLMFMSEIHDALGEESITIGLIK